MTDLSKVMDTRYLLSGSDEKPAVGNDEGLDVDEELLAVTVPLR